MNSISINQSEHIKQYYRIHSSIYDLTRWSFLFGRKNVLKRIPLLTGDVKSVLEIGCGTGHNLINLANKYPNAEIIGYDISEEMIEKASRATKMYPNIKLEKHSFPQNSTFDIILMSYTLTMINPGWENYLNAIPSMLSPQGCVAVVDFDRSPYDWFRRHMAKNHVRMEKHITPVLREHFKPFEFKVKKAYFGLWDYFIFIGKKRK